MFKVSNKNTRPYFTLFFNVYIVDFEQVSPSWDDSFQCSLVFCSNCCPPRETIEMTGNTGTNLGS